MVQTVSRKPLGISQWNFRITLLKSTHINILRFAALWNSCSWSYGSWIYDYLCNQWLSPLTLRVRIQLRRDVLDKTLDDKVCQWLVTGWWFSLGTPVSSINKTDRHNITEVVLKVALNTAPPKLWLSIQHQSFVVSSISETTTYSNETLGLLHLHCTIKY